MLPWRVSYCVAQSAMFGAAMLVLLVGFSQVVELKAALVRRHPNSVNALLAAAQPAAADLAAAAAAA